MALSYFHVLFQKPGEKEFFFFLLYNLYILSFDCSPILYINAINIKSRIGLDKTDCGDGDSAQLGLCLSKIFYLYILYILNTVKVHTTEMCRVVL